MPEHDVPDNQDDSPIRWKEKGNELFSKGQYEDAIRCYRRALELNPEYLDAWNNLGLALLKIGNTAEARQCNEKVKELKQKVRKSALPPVLHPATHIPLIEEEKQPDPPEIPPVDVKSVIKPFREEKTREREITYTKIIPPLAEEKEYCRNCGNALPYRIRDWPPYLLKLCPKCGIRIGDPDQDAVQEGIKREGGKNPTIAALLSVLPGLGQAYNGQVGRGLMFLFGTIIGLILFIVPGSVVWLFGIIDAHTTATRMNQGSIPFRKTSAKMVVGYILLLFVVATITAAGYLYFSDPDRIGILPPAGGAPNIATLEKIVEDYHETHTYLADDIYVCGDMASDVWNMVETKGIDAKIQIGNVDRDISSVSDINHAWVLAETSPNQWVALETTGGRLVYSYQNPRYFEGYSFETAREFKEFIQLTKQHSEQVSKYNAAVDEYSATIKTLNEHYEYSAQLSLLSGLNTQIELINQRGSDIQETNQKLQNLLHGMELPSPTPIPTIKTPAPSSVVPATTTSGPTKSQIRVQITSRTLWQGYYGYDGFSRSVKDSGSGGYIIESPDGRVWAEFYKSTGDEMMLKVELIQDGRVLKSGETTNPYGYVSLSV